MDSNIVKFLSKTLVGLVAIFTGKKLIDNAKTDYDIYKNTQNTK